MIYLKADGSTVIDYPYTAADLRADNPSTSFPEPPTEQDFLGAGASVVVETQRPLSNSRMFVEEGLPVLIDGAWHQVWVENTLPPPTREQVEAQRLFAYAHPTTGSDRHFAEGVRLSAMGAPHEEVEQAKERGALRYAEIQAEFPWPYEEITPL